MKHMKALLFALGCAASLSTAGCEWIAIGIAASDNDCEGYDVYGDCCDTTDAYGNCCYYDDYTGACCYEYDSTGNCIGGDQCVGYDAYGSCCVDYDVYGSCCYDYLDCEQAVGGVPTLTVNLPDWPPLGAASSLTADAQSDSGMSYATFQFVNVATTYFDGTGRTTVPCVQLGEGLGSLVVTAVATDAQWTSQTFDNVLVDLTPPRAFFDQDSVVLKPGATLDFWIGDAWIVGGWSLAIGDQTFGGQVDPGYPPTFGTEWDYTYVSQSLDAVLPGSYVGVLDTWDAAGNTIQSVIPITIDAVPPEAQIVTPDDGAQLNGSFQLVVTASDDTPLPVALEIRVGGALVATGASPQTTITLDTSEFAAGPTEIGVTAVDAAGNRSPEIVHEVVFGS